MTLKLSDRGMVFSSPTGILQAHSGRGLFSQPECKNVDPGWLMSQEEPQAGPPASYENA